eukprot:jgi/Psemu1/49033/gm1.49033_g
MAATLHQLDVSGFDYDKISKQEDNYAAQVPFLSVDYTKRMHELNHNGLNNEANQFSYHLSMKIEDVRTRLNSKKGNFDKDEALKIQEQCFKCVSEEVFPDYEEGDTDSIDHVWAMEDIKCYSNVGIGPEVQSREQERLEWDGCTFPGKEWCTNLTPEARERIKQCIHFNPGNRPCLMMVWPNDGEQKLKRQSLKRTDCNGIE